MLILNVLLLRCLVVCLFSLTSLELTVLPEFNVDALMGSGSKIMFSRVSFALCLLFYYFREVTTGIGNSSLCPTLAFSFPSVCLIHPGSFLWIHLTARNSVITIQVFFFINHILSYFCILIFRLNICSFVLSIPS